MESAICGFLFLILFLGVLINLRVTNDKRINEIKNKIENFTNKF